MCKEMDSSEGKGWEEAGCSFSCAGIQFLFFKMNTASHDRFEWMDSGPIPITETPHGCHAEFVSHMYQEFCASRAYGPCMACSKEPSSSQMIVTNRNGPSKLLAAALVNAHGMMATGKFP